MLQEVGARDHAWRALFPRDYGIKEGLCESNWYPNHTYCSYVC